MPTNAELEAMCEQALHDEEGHPDYHAALCKRVLALAIEVRDKTRLADIERVAEHLLNTNAPKKERLLVNAKTERIMEDLRSLLSEAQK